MSAQRLLHSKRFSDETQQTRRSQKNATHCEDQLGLVKLAWVTLYQTFRDFDIWRFDIFSSGQNEVFQRMLTGSPALSFSLPDPARRWSRLSPAHFFDRPHWPRAWNSVADLREGPRPSLFWVKKEEMTEGRKAGLVGKIEPGPLLSSKSGSTTVNNSQCHTNHNCGGSIWE